MKKFLLSLFALLGVLNAQAAWEKATSISVGDVVVLAFDNNTVSKELSTVTTSGPTIGSVVDYTTEPEGVYPLTIVAGSQDDTFAFKTTAGTYLAWSSGNSLTTAEEVADASSWTVSFTEAGAADIYNVGTAARKLQYNSESPRFACYTSSQQAPYLWKQVAGDDVAKPVLPSSTSFVGSIEVAITAAEGATIYYTLDGTNPTTESTVYSEALTITETTTVKAIAVVNEVASAPAEATYTALAKSTIAEAQAAAAGTTVYVEGVIVASAANGAVLYDGTDYLYYYNNANALVVGQKVRMVGTLATYGGAKQLPNSTTITELGTEAVAHPAAIALDGAAFDGIQTAAVATRQYVSFIGTLSISGNYYNLTIDGATKATASIVKPSEDLSALNGKEVAVKGYLMYVNNKYVYTVATSVKEVGAIENGDFSAATIIDNHICTYAKDMEANGTTFSQMQEVASWTIVNNGDARAAGVMAYYTDKWIGGTGFAVPAFNPAGGTGGQALGIVAVWSADAQYTQPISYKPGYYLVSARINNAGGTTATASNFFGACVGETKHFADNKTYEVGVWTRENVTFQVEAAAEGYISLGYKATNAGNASQQHLFYDGVIVKVFESEEALANFIEDQATADEADAAAYALSMARKKKLDELASLPIGDALFQYNATAVFEAGQAVMAAETAEAINAIQPAQNFPDAEKQYTLQQKATGLYMSLSDGVKLAAKAYPLSWVATEGGWYIKNEDLYVGLAGSDNWTMSTDPDKKLVITPAVITIEDAVYYTLNEVKGMIASDGTDAGSACYTDKSVAKSGDKAYWTIAEYVAPTLYTVSIAEGIQNGTVAAEPTSTEAGEKVQLTATPAEGYALESYSVTCKTIDEVVLVAEDGTFTMPADDVTVSATFVEAGPVSGVTLVASEGAYAASANNYVKEWTSNTNPIVTVTTGANNMDKRVTETFQWHSGSAGSSTYTIAVPINYIITSCTITAKGRTEEQTITAGEAVKTFGTEDYDELVISNLSNSSTSFTLTGANASGLLIQKIELGIAPNPNFNISNDKAYTLTTPRGSLGVSEGQLVSTAKDFTASNFAIISYNGAFYLWSVEAGRFIQNTGDASNYEPTPINLVELDGGKYQIRYGNNAINVSAGYAPGLVINSWTTVDEGNAYTIEAAADFDATEALAILATPITFTNKVTDLANLSDAKAYAITNARGTWNVDNGATAMNTKKLLPDAACEQFALLQQQGQYFIYSVNAKKFLNPDNTLGDPAPVKITPTDNEDYPWFFSFDASHNINVNGAGTVLIDGWSTIDAGNSNAIIEATDFDSKDALAALAEYFRLFADGKYYINNVGTGKYLAAGANWGTHAVVNADGLDYDIKMAEGKYTLDSQVSNGGVKNFLNGEWNDGVAFGWTFNEVSEGVYTISDGTNFLTAGEDGVVTLAADATVDAAKWTLKTLADRIAELAAATAETPVDATFLIQDANFGRNDLRKSAWTMVASNQNLSGGEDNNGSVGNNCAESFHSTFTLSQALTNAPAGKYKMTAQGFYRQDDGAIEDLPVFYANDKTANFPAKTGSEGSMTDASKSFSAGQYTIEAIEVTVFENGQLTVGAKGTAVHQWVIFDNFRLTYLGSEIPAEEFAPAYDAALAAAKAALADESYAAVTGEEKTALSTAIETYSTVEETVDAYKTAISALTAATTTFTGAKADYEALVAAKAANAERSYKYADADKKAAAEASLTAEATSAADAKEKTAAIWTAFRKYADSHALAEGVEGAINMTAQIVNPNAEEAIAEPWTLVKGEGSGGALQILDGEPLTDGDGNTYKYFDGGNWGANAWDVALKQTITLPAGKYMITASGRASGDVQLSLLVGEEKTAIPAIGASGGLFGNGWDDASKEFELATESDVVIGVQGVTSVVHNWMSFTRFRLVCLEKVEVPAVALNAPTLNAEAGTQAEPKMYPGDFKLKINFSADNLEANGYKAEDLKVKVALMVSGDLPENIMSMQSETAHRVLPTQPFYIDLGETDFPVELKQGYVYQNIAVVSATLVKPATEETEEEEIATYAGAPVQLHWIGIAPAVKFTVAANIESGTVEEPGTSKGFTTVEAGSEFKLLVSAENLEANGLNPEELTIEIGTLMEAMYDAPSWPMGAEHSQRIMKQNVVVPFAEEIVLEDVVFDKNFPFIQSINLMGLTLKKGDTPIAAIDEALVVRFIEVYENGVPVGIKGIATAGEKASIYDLSGRKVEKMQRGGIYIVNGKKVSVK